MACGRIVSLRLSLIITQEACKYNVSGGLRRFSATRHRTEIIIEYTNESHALMRNIIRFFFCKFLKYIVKVV